MTTYRLTATQATLGAIVLCLTGLLHGQEVLPPQRPQPAPSTQPPRDLYQIVRQDVLNITVWEHQELSGKFPVKPDGTVALPLVGAVPAAGQTVPQLEASLTRTLADGLVRNPVVSVTLDEYHTRRIFVFGSVLAPGMYALADSESLIQTLARAGYSGASEAVIIRPKTPTVPASPDSGDNADVIRVSLRDFEKDVERGFLGRNVVLKDGDTIFVPRVDQRRVFVTGKVRNIGAYSIPEGTTVLQVLSLAGGPTEEAAMNRLRLVRLEKGKQVNIKAKLSDIMQPGDTLIVPERHF